MVETQMTKQQGCLNGGIGSGRVHKLLIYFATLQIIMKSFRHVENSSPLTDSKILPKNQDPKETLSGFVPYREMMHSQWQAHRVLLKI